MRKLVLFIPFLWYAISAANAQEIEGVDPEVVYLMSDAERHMNDYFMKPNARDKELVMRYLDRAINMDSTFFHLYNKRAFAKAYLFNDYEGARLDFIRYRQLVHAMDTVDFSFNPYLFPAFLAIKTERYAEARQLTDSSLILYPVGLDYPHYLRGWVELLLGNPSVADSLWSKSRRSEAGYYRDRMFEDEVRYASIRPLDDQEIGLKIYLADKDEQKQVASIDKLSKSKQINFPIIKNGQTITFEAEKHFQLIHPFFFGIKTKKSSIIENIPDITEKSMIKLMEVLEDQYKINIYYLDHILSWDGLNSSGQISLRGQEDIRLKRIEKLSSGSEKMLIWQAKSKFTRTSFRKEAVWAAMPLGGERTFLLVAETQDVSWEGLKASLLAHLQTFTHSQFPSNAFRQ